MSDLMSDMAFACLTNYRVFFVLKHFSSHESLNFISEDNYTLPCLMAYITRGENIKTDTSCCVLLSTHHTLVETSHFLLKYLKYLTIYDSVILIAPFSFKSILENLGEIPISFIDVKSPVEQISKEVSVYSTLKIRKYYKWQPLILTPCEERTMTLLLNGFTPARIAKVLNLNEKTVSLQKRKVMKKYNVKSLAELLVKHRLMMEMHNVLRNG
jgi:DNA-binding CsgD family transcriptional regulator